MTAIAPRHDAACQLKAVYTAVQYSNNTRSGRRQVCDEVSVSTHNVVRGCTRTEHFSARFCSNFEMSYIFAPRRRRAPPPFAENGIDGGLRRDL